jgi:hypothetical protein
MDPENLSRLIDKAPAALTSTGSRYALATFGPVPDKYEAVLAEERYLMAQIQFMGVENIHFNLRSADHVPESCSSPCG